MGENFPGGDFFAGGEFCHFLVGGSSFRGNFSAFRSFFTCVVSASWRYYTHKILPLDGSVWNNHTFA